MKFCTHMYLDNLKIPIKFQGYRSKVKVTCFCVLCVHNAAATCGQYLALSNA